MSKERKVSELTQAYRKAWVQLKTTNKLEIRANPATHKVIIHSMSRYKLRDIPYRVRFPRSKIAYRVEGDKIIFWMKHPLYINSGEI